MTRAGLILAGLMALAPNVSQAAPAVPIKGQFLLQAEALPVGSIHHQEDGLRGRGCMGSPGHNLGYRDHLTIP